MEPMELVRHLVAYVHYPIVRLFFPIHVEGREHVPLGAPAILCPNHASYMDPAIVAYPLYFRPGGGFIRFLALNEYFQGPTGWYLRLYRSLPVRESGPQLGTFREALHSLNDGELLGIFPEGGRTRDGNLLPFQPGAARLAAEGRVPLIPVTLKGTMEAWPAQRRFPLPQRLEVIFHPPILPDHGLRKDPQYLTLVMEQVRNAVASRWERPE